MPFEYNDPRTRSDEPALHHYAFEYEPVSLPPQEDPGETIRSHTFRLYTKDRAYEYISDTRNRDLRYVLLHFDKTKFAAEQAISGLSGIFRRVANQPLHFLEDGEVARIHIEFDSNASHLRILDFTGSALVPLFHGQFALRRFHIPVDRALDNAADRALAYWLKRHPV